MVNSIEMFFGCGYNLTYIYTYEFTVLRGVTYAMCRLRDSIKQRHFHENYLLKQI